MAVTFNVVIDGKAAELTVEKASGALALLFGPAAFEIGTALHEKAAFFRLKNSLSIREKVRGVFEDGDRHGWDPVDDVRKIQAHGIRKAGTSAEVIR